MRQIDVDNRRAEVRQGFGGKDRVCWLPPSALPAVPDTHIIITDTIGINDLALVGRMSEKVRVEEGV